MPVLRHFVLECKVAENRHWSSITVQSGGEPATYILLLPGIMLLPGSFSGRMSSPRPQRGPEPRRRRSLAIFIRLHATVFNAPLTWTSASLLASASNLLGAVTNGNPELHTTNTFYQLHCHLLMNIFQRVCLPFSSSICFRQEPLGMCGIRFLWARCSSYNQPTVLKQ